MLDFLSFNSFIIAYMLQGKGIDLKKLQVLASN